MAHKTCLRLRRAAYVLRQWIAEPTRHGFGQQAMLPHESIGREARHKMARPSVPSPRPPRFLPLSRYPAIPVQLVARAPSIGKIMGPESLSPKVNKMRSSFQAGAEDVTGKGGTRIVDVRY